MAVENKFLLGVADCFLEPKEDVNANWSTNKFGGVPVGIKSTLYNLNFWHPILVQVARHIPKCGLPCIK